LNIANGNNTNLKDFYANLNPNLSCIQVDNVANSAAKWTVGGKNIDATASFSLNCSTTGIAEPNNINTLKVFPNPTNDNITIHTGNFSTMSNYTIKITTMLGQEVFNSKVTKQELSIDLNTLGGKGTYFLEIYDGGNKKIETKKLILQ